MHIVSPVIRTALTLAMLTLAAVLVVIIWQIYMISPWTRDGRVGAEVVQIAPEVSGTISDVPVVDNQFVHRGDILYTIDPERFRLALGNAQANVDAKREDMALRASSAERRTRLGTGVVSAETIEQTSGQVAIAQADYTQAMAELSLAKLNLEKATIRSPVDGYLTNLRLRPGDYAAAGTTKVAVLDAKSFWITGYFEETQIAQVHAGDDTTIRLMGFDLPIKGHVESLGHGIADANDSPDHLAADSQPGLHLGALGTAHSRPYSHRHGPDGVQLAAGMTCSIAVGTAEGSGSAKGMLISWLRAIL